MGSRREENWQMRNVKPFEEFRKKPVNPFEEFRQKPVNPFAEFAAPLMTDAQSRRQPSITEAVTDVPAEIGRTAGANLDTIKAGVTDRALKGPTEGLMDTGKALLAVPGLLASPITGAARSLIGHPMAQATHAIGTVIAPETAARDNPQEMYKNAAGDVENALSKARPAGAISKIPPLRVPSGALQISSYKTRVRFPP